MSDTTSGTPAPANAVPYTAVVAVPIGAVLCWSTGADRVTKARANAIGTSFALGIATNAAAIGSRVFAKYAGIINLTDAQWAAVTEEAAALTPGAAYYLSATTAGKITLTAPSGGGQFVALVGVAVSDNELQVAGLPQPALPSDLF